MPRFVRAGLTEAQQKARQFTKVDVIGVQERSDGGTHFVYVLEVHNAAGDAKTVFRRYRRFDALLQRLTDKATDEQMDSLPSLPSKKFLGRSHTRKVAEERIPGIDLFLRQLLASPFTADLAVIEFLKPDLEDGVTYDPTEVAKQTKPASARGAPPPPRAAPPLLPPGRAASAPAAGVETEIVRSRSVSPSAASSPPQRPEVPASRPNLAAELSQRKVSATPPAVPPPPKVASTPLSSSPPKTAVLPPPKVPKVQGGAISRVTGALVPPPPKKKDIPPVRSTSASVAAAAVPVNELAALIKAKKENPIKRSASIAESPERASAGAGTPVSVNQLSSIKLRSTFTDGPKSRLGSSSSIGSTNSIGSTASAPDSVFGKSGRQGSSSSIGSTGSESTNPYGGVRLKSRSVSESAASSTRRASTSGDNPYAAVLKEKALARAGTASGVKKPPLGAKPVLPAKPTTSPKPVVGAQGGFKLGGSTRRASTDPTTAPKAELDRLKAKRSVALDNDDDDEVQRLTGLIKAMKSKLEAAEKEKARLDAEEKARKEREAKTKREEEAKKAKGNAEIKVKAAAKVKANADAALEKLKTARKVALENDDDDEVARLTASIKTAKVKAEAASKTETTAKENLADIIATSAKNPGGAAAAAAAAAADEGTVVVCKYGGTSKNFTLPGRAGSDLKYEQLVGMVKGFLVQFAIVLNYTDAAGDVVAIRDQEDLDIFLSELTTPDRMEFLVTGEGDYSVYKTHLK
mmetsp:Transcript_34289/g.103383  ORF Transcript_34289/g.103383 Transcript_34289/m.103383 type:complete len:748 (-) Transcript_34289:353-2596(-)